MKKNMPKISVVMPVFNTPKNWLCESIESILNQSYSNFEFIIINDNSDISFNTKNIVDSFKDPRIKYFENQKNLGVIQCLNKLINLSTCDFIARMDADDISLPDRFKIQMDFLLNNPDVGVCGTQIKTFGEKIFQTKHKINPNFLDMISSSWVVNHPSIIIRKNLNPIYNLRYKHCEDYALWLDMSFRTKFFNIDKILLYYRIHSNNTSIKNESIANINIDYANAVYIAKYFDLDYTFIEMFLDESNITKNQYDYFLKLINNINNKMNSTNNYLAILKCYESLVRIAKQKLNKLEL